MDAGWQPVGLPHSFSIPYFMSPEFYSGYGWYRKHFQVSAAAMQQQLFLRFEGVFQVAEVFVNGKRAGRHAGGYTGFQIDITKAVHQGDNVVAVRVNNLWNAALAPRAGEHTFSGGIYRDVWLVRTSKIHIEWEGTCVTTPVVTEKKAEVKVRTEIKNDNAVARQIRLQTIVLSPKGKQVSKASRSITMTAGSVHEIEQELPPIVSPALWSTKDPKRYRVISSVFEKGKLTDQYVTPFGIRSIRWTADSGFFLNGRHLYLRGANVHQDHAGWGDAVTNAGFFRDVQMIKDAGFNFIRGSHYPHDPAFVEACDSLGILFWSENAFWGIGGFASNPEGYWNGSAYPTKQRDQPGFETSVKQQLSEMIKSFRNSPSVIAWSMSNEPFFTSPEVFQKMRGLLKQCVSLSHSLDPTRPAGIGGAQRPLDDQRIDKIGDVAGYNGDGGTLSLFQHPGVPSLVSEYGSTTADRPGQYAPGWGELAKDNGRLVDDWRSGQAVWCGFDHGSIAGSNLGKMGIIDYFRIPKRAWYWYRNAYRHILPPEWPVPGVPAGLTLTASKEMDILTDGTDDVQLRIGIVDSKGALISNSPPVTLTVICGPGRFPTGSSIKFAHDSDIRILDGQAAIEFRSYYSGKTVIQASSPGLPSRNITLEFSGPVPFVQGRTNQGKDLPYKRFRRGDRVVKEQQFGPNNPTFSSSQSEGHLSGLAADGNNATYWKASLTDNNPWWAVDTEKKLLIIQIKLILPERAGSIKKLEISDDRQNWKSVPAALKSKHQKGEHILVERFKKRITGRAIRVYFDNATGACISEVQILGEVLN